MPAYEAPSVELGSVPQTPSIVASPSSSEISSASSPEPPHVRATPLFRALAMPPPEPEQPPGQDELERRLPGYRRIIFPRELTLIELLKQSSGANTDEEVLRIREARLRVVAERVGLRRLDVLAPRLRTLILDGSALTSLRDLGVGLVHLKILSINRCGLTTLDGVWGLGALRELHAAGNRLQDLQLLAALQKLHTLNLADNPILESNRLWTLGVCGALRKLTLSGTPASDQPDYRSRVAAALPMLVYLDDRPLHTDVDYDSDGLFGGGSSSSNSDAEAENSSFNMTQPPPAEPESGPSNHPEDMSQEGPGGDAGNTDSVTNLRSYRHLRRRPATTENAGRRPLRPGVRRRPRTALDRPVIDEPTRLQILYTLMEDDEWLCSGSKLTSLDAVCGNLARALRRTSKSNHRLNKGSERDLAEQTMQDAARALAAEIPRAPRLDDWVKFREDTGRIDINIDFNERPQCSDPTKILDRLEQIEKETRDRFNEMKDKPMNSNDKFSYQLPNSALSSLSLLDGEICSLNDDHIDDESFDSCSLGMYFEEVNGVQSASSERVGCTGNVSRTE